MLKGVAAGLVALTLGVAPAAAANVSGWYAGIYLGASSPGEIDFSLDEFAGGFDGPGTIEQPTGFVNDGGVHPRLFDVLNTVIEDYPFADLGGAVGVMIDGRLDLLEAVSFGGVVGYGFGNGVRVEADVSSASFLAGDYTSISGVVQFIDGAIDGAGVWTWTNVFESPLPPPPPPPFPLSDSGLDYQTDVQFLLFNAFYDVDTGTVVSPYFGGGIGLARVTGTLIELCGCASFTGTVIAPAAQIGGGVRVALTDPVTLDIGYRYKLAATNGLPLYEIFDYGFGLFGGIAATQSGIIGVHTLQAGLTFALQ